MLKRKITGTALLASLAFLVSPFAHAADTASFIVVHGIPGRDVGPTVNPKLPVDVLVNKTTCLLKGLQFGQITNAVKVPAGTYGLDISLANTKNPCSNAAVISASATLAANNTVSIVASLTKAGAPTVQIFPINASAPVAGKERVINIHTAAAPTLLFAGTYIPFNFAYEAKVATGKSKNLDISSDKNIFYSLRDAKGTTEYNFGRFSTKDKGVYALFAVGSVKNNTLKILSKDVTKTFK